MANGCITKQNNQKKVATSSTLVFFFLLHFLSSGFLACWQSNRIRRKIVDTGYTKIPILLWRWWRHWLVIAIWRSSVTTSKSKHNLLSVPLYLSTSFPHFVRWTTIRFTSFFSLFLSPSFSVYVSQSWYLKKEKKRKRERERFIWCWNAWLHLVEMNVSRPSFLPAVSDDGSVGGIPALFKLANDPSRSIALFPNGYSRKVKKKMKILRPIAWAVASFRLVSSFIIFLPSSSSSFRPSSRWQRWWWWWWRCSGEEGGSSSFLSVSFKSSVTRQQQQFSLFFFLLLLFPSSTSAYLTTNMMDVNNVNLLWQCVGASRPSWIPFQQKVAVELVNPKQITHTHTICCFSFVSLSLSSLILQRSFLSFQE